MAVSRAKKVEQVEKLGAELKNVSSLIIATYSKLTVAQAFELRLSGNQLPLQLRRTFHQRFPLRADVYRRIFAGELAEVPLRVFQVGVYTL